MQKNEGELKIPNTLMKCLTINSPHICALEVHWFRLANPSPSRVQHDDDSSAKWKSWSNEQKVMYRHHCTWKNTLQTIVSFLLVHGAQFVSVFLWTIGKWKYGYAILLLKPLMEINNSNAYAFQADALHWNALYDIVLPFNVYLICAYSQQKVQKSDQTLQRNSPCKNVHSNHNVVAIIINRTRKKNTNLFYAMYK